MATRSNIGILAPDSSVTMIYCHWDGGINSNGVMLYDHYRTEDKVLALLELGDISMLGEQPEQCEAYARDRGEQYKEPRDYASALEASQNMEEYLYLFDVQNTKWIYCDYKKEFRDLALAFLED